MHQFKKCSILTDTESHYSGCSDKTTLTMDVSCWLIEFKDGHKIIISEQLYEQEEKRNWLGRERICEQHWFSLRKCRERNEGIGVFMSGTLD